MAEQFFGFKPSGFVDDVFNTVDEYIAQAVDSLEQAAEEELKIKSSSKKGAAAARSELKEGCDGLVEQLQQIFHKNIDLFEMYVLKNIFVLPAALESDAETAGSEETDEQDSKSTEASELDAEIAQLTEAVAAARVRHRTLQRVQRMYSKRMPALRSDAERLSAISQSMVHASAAQDGASAAAAASPSAPSGAPSLAELTTQAAEAVALCDRLAEAAGSTSGADSKPASRGKARQSFGGVMSQFERDVKKLGGGQRKA